jgi:hypothetical protein
MTDEHEIDRINKIISKKKKYKERLNELSTTVIDGHVFVILYDNRNMLIKLKLINLLQKLYNEYVIIYTISDPVKQLTPVVYINDEVIKIINFLIDIDETIEYPNLNKIIYDIKNNTGIFNCLRHYNKTINLLL